MRLVILTAIFASIAAAQAVRFDPLAVTTTAGNTPPGGYSPVLAIPGSTIKLCTSNTCVTRATTYSDGTAATPCPALSPVVLAGTAVCTPYADQQGNFGFWILPGTYWYQITLPNSNVYGPFPFSAGGGAGGSGVLTFGPAGSPRTGNVVTASGDYNSLQISGAAYNATFSATPTFDLSQGTIQTITLSGTVTGAFLMNQINNLWYQFLICQDAVGQHSFTWPGTVHGAMSVGLTQNKCSLQVFLANGGQLYAVSTGVTNQ
jgi:hypothetical protein